MPFGRVIPILVGVISAWYAVQVWRDRTVVVVDQRTSRTGTSLSIGLIPRDMLDAARPAHKARRAQAVGLGLVALSCIAVGLSPKAMELAVDRAEQVLRFFLLLFGSYVLLNGISLLVLGVTHSTWMRITLLGVQISFSDPQALPMAAPPNPRVPESTEELVSQGADVTDPLELSGQEYITSGTPSWVRGLIQVAGGAGIALSALVSRGSDSPQLLDLASAVRDSLVWCSSFVLLMLAFRSGAQTAQRGRAMAVLPLLGATLATALGLIAGPFESMSRVMSAFNGPRS